MVSASDRHGAALLVSAVKRMIPRAASHYGGGHNRRAIGKASIGSEGKPSEARVVPLFDGKKMGCGREETRGEERRGEARGAGRAEAVIPV